MKAIAENFHVVNNRIPLRLILISVGCVLLLGGNALPWPCASSPDPWPDCYPLIIYHANMALYAVILLIGIPLIVVTMYLTDPPQDSIVWYILLLVPYVLFIAKLRPDSFTGEMYFPLIDVNEDLGGPSILVLPASLIAAWLTLRPKALHIKLRLLATIALVSLLFLTAFLLTLMGNRPYQITVSSFMEHQGFWRTGPLLILAGGILLLGKEAAEYWQDRKRAAVPERSAIAVTNHLTVNKIGFWAALLACASPILSIALSLLAADLPIGRQYDAGSYYLFSAFALGIEILLPLSFLVLMASLYYYSPREKRIWLRIGLFFASIYLLGYALTTFFFSFMVGNSPEFYERLAASFPLLLRYGAIQFLSFLPASVALLFTLPVFHSGSVEVAIRWCLISLGMLTVASGSGYWFSSARVPGFSVLMNFIGQMVVFPVVLGLIAVVFRRAEKEGVERE